MARSGMSQMVDLQHVVACNILRRPLWSGPSVQDGLLEREGDTQRMPSSNGSAMEAQWKHSGAHLRAVLVQHEVGDMEVFDHTEWSSTCPLLVAVLTETCPNRPGDLSCGVGMRSVPSLADLSCLLCDCVVQRVRKGGGPPPPMIVDSEERQMTVTLHRLMGSVARRL